MLENRSFDHMFGYLTIDQPKVPGDKIDNLHGDESNLDSGGTAVPVCMGAKYCGAYRVAPGHHYPDVTGQPFQKDDVRWSPKPTMGGVVKHYGPHPEGGAAPSHR